MRVSVCGLWVMLCVLGCSEVLQPDPTEQLLRRRRAEQLLVDAVTALREDTPRAYARAEAKLSLAAELLPDDARVFDGLGCLALRRGERARARALFLQSLAADPRYARVMVNLAYLEELEGRESEAQMLLRRALSLNPLEHRGRNNYAAMLWDSGRQRAAHLELLKALSEAPKGDREPALNLELFQRSVSEAPMR